MEPQRKSGKGKTPNPAGMEALRKEAEENFAAWTEDPPSALARMRSLPSGERVEVFSALIRAQGDEVYPLFQALLGQDEGVDLALAESLGRWNSPEAGILLHRLAGRSPSKAVQKSVRKALFRLRSQGVGVGELKDESPAVFHPPKAPPPEGFLSLPDPGGSRLVWLVRPQLPQGIVAYHVMLSDTRGILDFQALETTRKKFHEYSSLLRKESPWPIVEADPDYCLALIVEAEEIHRKKGEPLPDEFTRWRPLMGAVPSAPLKPLIYLHLKEEEFRNRADLLDHSPSLFQTPPFEGWFLEKEEAEKYLPRLKEASESRLVLTPYQQEARLMEIYRQAVSDLFDAGRRALLRRRLEEMAYVLWKAGKENDARTSLAAALRMETAEGILTPHPFLLELVKRSLGALLEQEAGEREKKAEELLIKP